MMEDKGAISDEASAYVASHPVLRKLAKAFCAKYRSLGHWGGTAVLKNLSKEEQEDLSIFLRQQTEDGSEFRLRYADFAAAWKKTRFADLPLEEFLTAMHPGKLRSKREAQIGKQQERQQMLLALLREFLGTKAEPWLNALLYGQLRLAHNVRGDGGQLMHTVAKGLSELPAAACYERLPFFANRVTGNPHAFDWDKDEGKIFLQALSFLSGGLPMGTTEEKTELLYRFCILRDDILNFASAFGLAGYQRNFDGSEQEISYWQEAAMHGAPLNLPFREIVRAQYIRSFEEKNSSAPFPVFIVENSGVFSTLLDVLQSRKKVRALLCLHGQLKTASWAILDRLAASGAVFHYSGDFDPEGMLIAQKLRQHFRERGCGNCVRLWHFSTADYRRTDVMLPAQRLKLLDAICDDALLPLVSKMREWQCAFYQESLMDLLLMDLL